MAGTAHATAPPPSPFHLEPSTPRPRTHARDGWRAGSLILIAASLGLHLAATAAAEPLRSANDRSRWATVRALAETGSFRIDPYERDPRWSTIDQVQVGGRLYSTKPALLPLAVTAVLLPVRALTGWDLATDPAPATRWVLIVVNLLPFAAALWVTRGLLTDFARTDFARFLALGTLAFGTPLSAFLPVLNNHTVAGCCAALALAPLVRVRDARPSRTHASGSGGGAKYAAAGFFAALTACNELPAGLFGLLAFAVCARADRRRTLRWFAPAAAVPLLAFLAATLAQTGGGAPFYLRYGTAAYEFVRGGVPSYWLDPTGLDAARDGFWTYLFHCTLGHHGLFSLTPVWLLSAWSATRCVRSLLARPPQADDSSSPSAPANGPHPLAFWAAATWLLAAAVLAFYLTRTANYNYGGTSVALRWLVWLAPLWAVALVPLADAFANRGRFRWLAAGLLGASIASAWVDSPNPWQHPWLMRAMGSAGRVEPERPPAPFPEPVFTWFDPPPLRIGGDPTAGEIAATYRTPTPTGGLRTLRLALTAGPGPPRLAVALDGREWSGGVNPERFSPHVPPSRWFVAGDEPPAWVADLLRGLPARKPYNRGRPAYPRTPLRPDALPARRRAVRTAIAGREYRVDAVVSDEAPFGAVSLVRTVRNASGALLTRETWTLSETTPPIPPTSTLTPADVRTGRRP